jgi:tripartite-type tricarboxylate transporter receptor subunit TctC
MVAGPAGAQNFPERGVTIIVPTTAGDSTDLIARLLAKNLAAKWGKSVIVENRPGGGTLIGAGAVAKAAPDGHTLLMMFSGTLLNAALHKQMPINFEKDLIPVAHVVDTPFVLIANPSLPANNLQELIAYAKAKPGELSYGTVGPGSLQHLALEVFNSAAGTKMVAIPYAGTTPTLTALIGGQIHLAFAPVGASMQFIKSGQARALGVGSPQRVAAAADFPTIAEAGLPGFNVVSWQMMAVTGGTPRNIVDQLNKDVYEAASHAEVQEAIAKLNLIPKSPASVAQIEALLKSELDKWRPVLTDIGLVR